MPQRLRSRDPSASAAADSDSLQPADESLIDSPHVGHYSLPRSSQFSIRFPSLIRSSPLLFAVPARFFSSYFSYLTLFDRLSLSASNKYFFQWAMNNTLVYPFKQQKFDRISISGGNRNRNQSHSNAANNSNSIHYSNSSNSNSNSHSNSTISSLSPSSSSSSSSSLFSSSSCCSRGLFLSRLQSRKFLERRKIQLENHLEFLENSRLTHLNEFRNLSARLDPTDSLYLLFAILLGLLYRIEINSIIQSIVYFPSRIYSFLVDSVLRFFSCGGSSSTGISGGLWPWRSACYLIDFLCVGESVFLAISHFCYYSITLFIVFRLWLWFTGGITQWMGNAYFDANRLKRKIKRKIEKTEKNFDENIRIIKKKLHNNEQRLEEAENQLRARAAYQSLKAKLSNRKESDAKNSSSSYSIIGNWISKALALLTPPIQISQINSLDHESDEIHFQSKMKSFESNRPAQIDTGAKGKN